ncbi:MAG: ADP-ribosylglycohydrolase family protein [Gemmataceae bacterium]|nr:ADP-ribosylglycohydrolase family protein [Gemmataceae bacterium]
MTTAGRARGCLLGLAAGDALGTTLEFRRPGTFTPIDDMIGGGPFDLDPGQWTDDTSMALCLAESLLEREFDPVHQLETYCRWYRHGHWSSTGRCFDIGNATRAALVRFEIERCDYAGSTDPNSAGNGSLMRLAPVPIRWSHSPDHAIHFAALSSKTTHAADECVDACRFYTALIVAALNGEPKDAILARAVENLKPKVAAVAAGSYREKEPPAIVGSGYVVQSLEAALWAFHKSTTFRDGALLAVNLGNDADTTGAIYGQLAGAYYGEVGIPSEWRAKLTRRAEIADLAERLHARSLS